MIKYFPKYSALFFISAFVIMCFFYGYYEIFSMRPQGLHQWRQCDCLSITSNYYNEGMNFFEPAINHCGSDGSGKTVSDFPIIYYTVAAIWKIIGQNEMIFRIITLIIFFTALTLLYRILEDLLQDSIWAVLLPLLLFTSPMLVYYSNNFLTNVPSLSFDIIGWCFFYRFYKSKKYRNLYLSFGFFLFAGLLKITGLMGFVIISFIFVVEFLIGLKSKKSEKIFHKPVNTFIPIISVVIILVLWYLFALNYNNIYNKNFFLIGIIPIWDIEKEQIKAILENIKVIWIRNYFSKHLQIIAVISIILVFIKSKKTPKLFIISSILFIIGFIISLMFWFQALQNHDYYLINFLVIWIFVMISFSLSLKNNYPKIFHSVITKIIITIVLIYNVYLTSKNIKDRYEGWMNSHHLQYTKALETITPYLRELGIERNDLVISIPDNSINISLYLMDQKGYTSYGTDFNDSSAFANKINLGVKYLIINDTSLLSQDFIQPFLKDKIGEYQNINIYDLQNILK